MYEVKIFTLYPEIFPGPLAGGIYGKAMNNGLWSLKTINIRDYAEDKHKTVDDTVFGGGSGMLMKPDVVARSLDKNISWIFCGLHLPQPTFSKQPTILRT